MSKKVVLTQNGIGFVSGCMDKGQVLVEPVYGEVEDGDYEFRDTDSRTVKLPVTMNGDNEWVLLGRDEFTLVEE